MTAFDVMRKVEAAGGTLRLEADQLYVSAPGPLPAELMAEITASKPAIMMALGAPIDCAITGILTEVRPFLSPALQWLSDDRLLALVNWNVITAWDRAVRNAGRQ